MAMYLTEPLEPRSMTLVHALGNFAVVTLHVTSPVFRFNSGLFSVNLDGRVTGTRHTPVLAASKPLACQALSGEAEDSLSWCRSGSREDPESLAPPRPRNQKAVSPLHFRSSMPGPSESSDIRPRGVHESLGLKPLPGAHFSAHFARLLVPRECSNLDGRPGGRWTRCVQVPTQADAG